MYSSTLSLISVLDKGVWSTPKPLYPFERNPVQETGWVPAPVWTAAGSLAPQLGFTSGMKEVRVSETSEQHCIIQHRHPGTGTQTPMTL
jgi:hypothetical protein